MHWCFFKNALVVLMCCQGSETLPSSLGSFLIFQPLRITDSLQGSHGMQQETIWMALHFMATKVSPTWVVGI